MSISVKNSNNEWVQVAGQGRAEYGASTVRRGTVTISIDPQQYTTVPVTFATPMPDADYLVDVSFPTQQPISYYVVNNRTKNGFQLFIKNEGGGSADASVTYTAFKLYTDTEYNNLLNNAVLTSDVTNIIENGNMNPVTSNAVHDADKELYTKTVNNLKPTTLSAQVVLANNAGDLSTARSYTASQTGLLRVHFLKLYAGNTIFLVVNGQLVDSVPNYTGPASDVENPLTTGVLIAFVRAGDSISINCDGNGQNWYVQNVTIQPISWFIS